MKSLYLLGHPVPEGLYRAMTKQTVGKMYNDVSLQRVRNGFNKTADLKYACPDSNKGRKVNHGSVTDGN